MTSADSRGLVIWLTGLPCAGKSTIARRLAPALVERGHRVEILDGDAVREHLSAGLGFSRSDRDTNVRRIAFVAELLARNGVFVVVAAVSPFAATRREIREHTRDFFEVHVDCPARECERRDVKGMYALARAGKIVEFTGVDGPYEPPPQPELRVETERMSIDESVRAILAALEGTGALRGVRATGGS